jgi:hypothetical protein
MKVVDNIKMDLAELDRVVWTGSVWLRVGRIEKLS